MDPIRYTVTNINGDYAYMISDTGIENQVAMFLLVSGFWAWGRTLPPETECFASSILKALKPFSRRDRQNRDTVISPAEFFRRSYLLLFNA